MSKSNPKKSTEEVKPTKPARPATTFRLSFKGNTAPDAKSWRQSFAVGALLGASVSGIVIGAAVLTGASLSDLVSTGE